MLLLLPMTNVSKCCKVIPGLHAPMLLEEVRRYGADQFANFPSSIFRVYFWVCRHLGQVFDRIVLPTTVADTPAYKGTRRRASSSCTKVGERGIGNEDDNTRVLTESTSSAPDSMNAQIDRVYPRCTPTLPSGFGSCRQKLRLHLVQYLTAMVANERHGSF